MTNGPGTVVLVSVIGGATDEQLDELRERTEGIAWADEIVVWNDVEPEE